MDLSEFTANYSQLGDDQLLCLWADRNALLPEAVRALESEIQRRGLKKENAERIKRRFDRLAARDAKGRLGPQVATAKYERKMRHFVGWEEPEFYSPYGGRDIRNSFAHIRHKYRVWKAFRDRTDHWPIFSICFCFLSWMAMFGLALAAFVWVEERKWTGAWRMVAVLGCVFALFVARELGARLMRKLDWRRFGA
jgi:hypothetical protein